VRFGASGAGFTPWGKSEAGGGGIIKKKKKKK